MNKYTKVLDVVRKVCSDNCILFEEKLAANGKCFQWNFSHYRTTAVYWPHTKTFQRKYNKVELDSLFEALSNQFMISLPKVVLSDLIIDLIPQDNYLDKYWKKLAKKMVLRTLPNGKKRFFLKNDCEFNEVYEHGFKNKTNLVKAYYWFENNRGKIYSEQRSDIL